MTQQKSKKAWVKPELIVLVRSLPEVAVLTACKYHIQSGPDGLCISRPGELPPPMCSRFGQLAALLPDGRLCRGRFE